MAASHDHAPARAPEDLGEFFIQRAGAGEEFAIAAAPTAGCSNRC